MATAKATDGSDRHEFRPWFGQVLTGVIGAIGAVSFVAFTWQQGLGTGLRALPFLALATAVCWALFWRPCVTVDTAGVTLVNVTRTIRLPWPSIQAVDTKWALTLITAYGRFTAWAAPAPGAAHVVRNDARREARNLPASTFGPDGIRPGDLPTSPSGGAALMIRERWERLRDAGHLDDPRLEFDRPPVRWHVEVGAALMALVIACVVSVLV